MRPRRAPSTGLARAVAKEALAYARTGLYLTTKAKVAHPRPSKVGVLMIAGVQAERSQFRALALALQPAGVWMDGFDYPTSRPFAQILGDLEHAIADARRHAERLVLVGHSLGGLLASLYVQADHPPAPHVSGLVTVCAPLHGTTRGRLAPWKDVRGITPDGPHIQRLAATRHRLKTWGHPVLAIGSDRDAFLDPIESAFLREHPSLLLDGSGHVASLFDARTHQAIRELVTSRF